MKTEIIKWPKNYCTYKDGPELYSLSSYLFRKYAINAQAVIHPGLRGTVLIDCRILEEYMKAKNIKFEKIS